MRVDIERPSVNVEDRRLRFSWRRERQRRQYSYGEWPEGIQYLRDHSPRRGLLCPQPYIREPPRDNEWWHWQHTNPTTPEITFPNVPIEKRRRIKANGYTAALVAIRAECTAYLSAELDCRGA